MKTIFFESIDNTQNYALENYDSEPLLVLSYSQESGRGREKKEWQNADQSLAVSLVFENNNEKLNNTLVPLIAGFCFLEVVENEELKLKWPNDINLKENKIGGILVEEHKGVICVGLGVNYFWANPSIPNAGSLYDEKIDNTLINSDAEKWGRLVLDFVENNKFKLPEYKEKLTTLGKLVEYPEGRGWARDVDIDGSLIIETPEGQFINLTSPLITEVK
ncbi:MAG: biotin--[acetyl-CoA-carboxylase] ligase [Rhodobacteraceae bacterium]|nr:MAG: biotin--[acetyl-CoA-carboxylase] ligase [Paracoccaceae bacterium]|tara:strand:- start:1100 stop:1756 length:657 start_codon:yes stop_codon:yes gene_type:complete